HWQPCLHDLGECEVKHGLHLHLFSLYKDGLGNPQVPEKLKRGRRKHASAVSVRSISAPRWPRIALPVALLVSTIALVVSSLIFFNRASPPTTTPPAPGPTAAGVAAPIPEKSIAVLPFENLSDEKENAYFADGVQDEILTGLARVADLKVISRTSVMQYKGGLIRNLREVAKELGVAHLLGGSVQRTGGRVRVSAQLIDARTDTQLWAERYDRDVADVFAIESEVAGKIVAQLQAKISPSEKAAIEKAPTTDLVAYDLYLSAEAVFAITGGPATSWLLPNSHCLIMPTSVWTPDSSIVAKAIGKKQRATWSAPLNWTRAISSFSSNSLWLTSGSIAMPKKPEPMIEH